jgi:hypothetical protein
MVMKREGRLVWLAWFKFRGDPLMIVAGVLKEILRSLSSVLLYPPPKSGLSFGFYRTRHSYKTRSGS